MTDRPDDTELLPVLVADLADEDGLRVVDLLAHARRIAFLPLVDPPVDGSLHVLEITTAGSTKPLLVLAEPVGAPTERGYPLRLHPFDSPPKREAKVEVVEEDDDDLPPVLRAPKARPANRPLTKRHTRDLLGEGRDEGADDENSAESFVGRSIAQGKLVVEALVGIGGMGAVYRARHKQLGREVAVKVLHERYRQDIAFAARFHAEALAVSSLDHPNLVRVLDYGQEPDGVLYLAMDFLQGIELGDFLRREGTLPLTRIVDIAMQVCAGLGHAHARGIIHRDVKPSNIVLVERDDDEGGVALVAKVCDFGIAVRGESASGVVGTPAYMSPEQCEGTAVDARTDIYALGAILYELATGRVPFVSDDEAKVVAMQKSELPEPPSRIRALDARLELLILRMLAKAPQERPQNMREMRAELRELLKPPVLTLHEVGAGRSDRKSDKPGPPPLPKRPPPKLSTTTMTAVVNVPAIAAVLAREPVSALRERLATPERFTQEGPGLASAMRLLLEQREYAALASIVGVFRKIAVDAEDPRADLALRLVRALADPAWLAGAAEKALEADDEAASALLGSLGLAAAHALYGARLKMHPTPPLRGRFVAAIRAIGAAAWPLLSAALDRNVPGDARQHDPRLAEDVLRALPSIADERAGSVVSTYLRWGEPSVRRAAIAPLVSLWGDRARPLLLAVLLRDDDEAARVAAMKGLRELGAIDEHVVRKIASVLEAEASAALVTAIAEALGDANDEAKKVAAEAARRALTPKGGMAMRARSGPNSPPYALLAMARAYVHLGGAEATKLVEDIARACEDPLRTQLRGVLAR